jgi:transposase InsO family protein
MELRDLQPGKPDPNAFIERFNRTYRTEVVNVYVSESLIRSGNQCEMLTELKRKATHRCAAGCLRPGIEPDLRSDILGSVSSGGGVYAYLIEFIAKNDFY